MKDEPNDNTLSPDTGPLCDHCGHRIPEFSHVSEAGLERVRSLMRETKIAQAVMELEALAGCPRAWAKLWVDHNGVPIATTGRATCPYCHALLRTSLAKQCLSCGMDWHNSEVPETQR